MTRSPNLVYTPTEDVSSLAALLDFDLVMMSVIPYSYFSRFVNKYAKTKDGLEDLKIYTVYLRVYTNIEIMNEKRRQLRELQ